ncbi:hypothetical protein BH11BAC7_BH11BAC7_32890 [soil metagenome]
MADFISAVLRMDHMNNMPVFHIYTVIEFTWISLFYIKAVPGKKITALITALILLFLVLAAYEFRHNMNEMDVLSTTTEAFIVMFYAVLGFSLLLKNPVHSKVTSIPLFWINTAFLLYFAGNLFLFIFSSYVQQHFKKEFNELWGIHSIMSLIYYLLIATGFWKTKAR